VQLAVAGSRKPNNLCIACTIRLTTLTASPPVQFIVKKSKCAGLAQEIGFSAPNSQLAVAGKRYNIVVHLQSRV
jgi:hypothetical protein